MNFLLSGKLMRSFKQQQNLHKQFAQSDEIFWKMSHVSSSIKLELMITDVPTASFAWSNAA